MSDQADVMAYVRTGMPVRDLRDNQIGTVAFVKPPDGAFVNLSANETYIQEIEFLESISHLPVQLREHLVRNGFIKINSGQTRAYYALPGHIAEVTAKELILNDHM